jgi:heme oxygenase
MKTLSAPQTSETKDMDQSNAAVQKIHEEFTSFHNTMEELYMLKQVAADLRNYRKMIKLKKYD